MENLNKQTEIIDVVRQYVNDEIDERIKYELSQFPKDSTSIQQLKHCFCNDLVESLLPEELECPIKISEKYFGKVNEDTIKKAFQNIDWTDYNKSAELLAVDKINVYLNSKCKYLNLSYDAINELSLSVIINIFRTLGLSREIYLDFIKSCFFDFERISKRYAEILRDCGQNSAKGTICQHCFGLNKSPYFKSTNDIEMEENDK